MQMGPFSACLSASPHRVFSTSN